jgi:hypothetical protein
MCPPPRREGASPRLLAGLGVGLAVVLAACGTAPASDGLTGTWLTTYHWQANVR